MRRSKQLYPHTAVPGRSQAARGRSARFRLVSLGFVLAALLALPGVAHADSIVYTKGGDIYLASPDGSHTYRVTNTGAYGFASQSDDGTIVAVGNDGRFHRLNRQGQHLNAPFYPGVPGDGDKISSPLDPAVSPDGSKIAYWYIIRGGYFDPGCNCQRTTGQTSWAVSDAEAMTPESKYESQGAYAHPSWIGNGRLLGSFLGASGPALKDVATDTVRAGKANRGDGRAQWFDGPSTDHYTVLQDGEVTRDLKKMAFVGSDWTNSGPPNQLVFYDLRGLPEDDPGDDNPYTNEDRNPPSATCTLTVPNAKLSDITWSPDGGQLAWADGENAVYAMAVPPSSTCEVPPVRLIAQGGSSPDWGPADVPPGTGAPDGDPDPDPAGPVIGSLKLSPAKFRTGAGRGTKISYTLSEPAAVAFVFERVLPGKRVGSRCVAPTRGNRKARPCKRYGRVPGGIVKAGGAGPNSLSFTGRVNKRTLTPGSYRLSAVAVDADRNQSAVVQRGFKVVR